AGSHRDPGVTPSLQRAIRTLPASQQIELALWIIMDGDIGDYDPNQHEKAENTLIQMVADAREADRAEAVKLADGRPSLNPWAPSGQGYML
ncbi:MAG TPA: hypothetical protein VF637_10325, partial [Sphingomicrobium sp.]